MLDITIPSSKI